MVGNCGTEWLVIVVVNSSNCGTEWYCLTHFDSNIVLAIGKAALVRLLNSTQTSLRVTHACTIDYAVLN